MERTIPTASKFHPSRNNIYSVEQSSTGDSNRHQTDERIRSFPSIPDLLSFGKRKSLIFHRFTNIEIHLHEPVLLVTVRLWCLAVRPIRFVYVQGKNDTVRNHPAVSPDFNFPEDLPPVILIRVHLTRWREVRWEIERKGDVRFSICIYIPPPVHSGDGGAITPQMSVNGQEKKRHRNKLPEPDSEPVNRTALFTRWYNKPELPSAISLFLLFPFSFFQCSTLKVIPIILTRTFFFRSTTVQQQTIFFSYYLHLGKTARMSIRCASEGTHRSIR